jgi:hypothetical protein
VLGDISFHFFSSPNLIEIIAIYEIS